MTTDVDDTCGDVPRETLEKLVAFEALVRKWSGAINLVARSTLPDLRRRHIEDSVFIARTARDTESWLDIGSGAGFPGLVVAILHDGRRQVTLVESDWRKAEFLKAARRDLAIDVEIMNERMENVPPLGCGIISARAVAPLSRLLDLCHPQLGPETTLILPKGKSWRQEVLASQKMWEYDLEIIDNPVSDGGVVLKISKLVRTAHEA